MKKLLTLLVFVAGFAQAQNRIVDIGPNSSTVVIGSRPTGTNNEMIYHVAKEGSLIEHGSSTYYNLFFTAPSSSSIGPASFTTTVYNTTATSTTFALGTPLGSAATGTVSYSVRNAKSVWMRKFTVKASDSLLLYVSIRQGSFYGQFFSPSATGVGDNKPGFVDRKYDYVHDFGPAGLFLYEGGSISVVAYSTKQGQRNPWVILNMDGNEVSGDMNYSAKKTILLSGVSIDWGTLGNNAAGSATNTGGTLYSMRLWKYFRDQGIDVHLVNKGFGQSKSIEAERAINTGAYDDITYDLLIAHEGENDAASAFTPITTFKQNLCEYIRHRNRFRPNAPILFIMPATSDVPNIGPNLSTYRQGVIDVANGTYVDTVTGLALGGTSNNVYFYDPINPITSSNTLTLATSNNVQGSDFTEKTLLSQLHWQGDTGHLKVYQGIVEKLGSILTTEIKKDHTRN